jgi:hypothetical protein
VHHYTGKTVAKEFQLIHITLDHERLRALSNRRRNQFAGCMHAHNELAVLNRLLMFVLNDTGEGDLHDSAQSVQMWCVLQILAAKLFETWVMIGERFLRSNPPEFVSSLEPVHQDSFRWLTNYFGVEKAFKDSALKIIRDKTAFHYDRLNLGEAGDNLNATENSLYLAEHAANSLYYSGSAIVFRAIFALISAGVEGSQIGSHGDRVSRGVKIALDDAQNANTNMHALLYGLIRLLMDGVVAAPDLAPPQVRINVFNAPAPKEIGIPSFIDVGP